MNCPSCGQSLSPGPHTRCPHCAALLSVPAEGALAPSPQPVTPPGRDKEQPLREIPGLRKRERTCLTNNGRVLVVPKLNHRRAVFVLSKIDEILAWERRNEAERDTRFVDLSRYLCEVRAGQLPPWRVHARYGR